MSGHTPEDDAAGADPSMEDILASIRRILSEDEGSAPSERLAETPPAAPAPDPARPRSARKAATERAEPRQSQPEVLALDASMMVQEPHGSPAGLHDPGQAPSAAPFHDLAQAPPAAALHETGSAPMVAQASAAASAADRPPPAVFEDPTPMPSEVPEPNPPASPSPESSLVAPEAAAAAASSVGSLLRTLGAGRQMQVTRAGVTLEDLVRDELRPLVKAWLDANLPPLVERLVRAEIERVVGRAADL